MRTKSAVFGRILRKFHSKSRSLNISPEPTRREKPQKAPSNPTCFEVNSPSEGEGFLFTEPSLAQRHELSFESCAERRVICRKKSAAATSTPKKQDGTTWSNQNEIFPEVFEERAINVTGLVPLKKSPTHQLLPLHLIDKSNDLKKSKKVQELIYENFSIARSAAVVGDRQKIKECLKKDSKLLERVDSSGRSLLFYCLLKDSDSLLRWLLTKNANLKLKDHQQRTILHWAAEQNATGCLQLVLPHLLNSHLFAWCMQGDMDGLTPLHLVISGRSSRTPIDSESKEEETESLELLLSAISKWAHKKSGRKNPESFNQNKEKLVETFYDRRGRSPLHYAAICGYVSGLQMLLEFGGFDVGKTDTPCERTAAMYAILCQDQEKGSECLRFLMEADLNNNASRKDSKKNKESEQNYDTVSSLSSLSRSRHDSSGFLSVKDKSGLGMVHLAAIVNNQKALRILAGEWKFPVNRCYDKNSRTPLHFAAIFGKIEACDLLLEYGAHMHRDNSGATPLHYAAMKDHTEIVEMLVPRFGWKDITDSEGRTSFQWAVVGGAIKTVARMLTLLEVDRNHTDRNGNTALHLAAEMGAYQILKLLLIKGWDPQRQNSRGLTPLMVTVSCGNYEAMVALVNADKDPVAAVCHIRDVDGRTALHWSCFAGETAICQHLVQMCSEDDLDVQDFGLRTPLHCAVFAGAQGCVNRLLQGGANPIPKDRESQTPLHFAAAVGNHKIAIDLLEAGHPPNLVCYPYQAKNGGLTALDIVIPDIKDRSKRTVYTTLRDHGGLTYRKLMERAARVIQRGWLQYSNEKQKHDHHERGVEPGILNGTFTLNAV